MATAMIFAAGLGTRLGAFTARKPKALVEVGGKPLLQHAIEKLKQSGFERVVVNVHHFADQVIAFLQQHNFGVEVLVSDERDRLLDTGGGLKKAVPLLRGCGPILLCNVDIITSLDYRVVMDFHQAHNDLATLVVRQRHTSRYFLFDYGNMLAGWTNISTGVVKQVRELTGDEKQLAFSGIQVVSPQLLDLITEEGVFSLVELYLRLAQHHPIGAYVDDSSLWMDLGKPDQLREAERRIGELGAGG